jgi:hypothetical protein
MELEYEPESEPDDDELPSLLAAKPIWVEVRNIIIAIHNFNILVTPYLNSNDVIR